MTSEYPSNPIAYLVGRKFGSALEIGPIWVSPARNKTGKT